MIKSSLLIIGAPRSGSTLLFNILSDVPALWSIGYESKEIIERYHHPRTKNWESGSLTADDLTPKSRDFILRAFESSAAPGTFWRKVNHFRSRLRDNRVWNTIKRRGQGTGAGSKVGGALPQQGLDIVRRGIRLHNRWRGNPEQSIRLLEKTPENCLRLPFLLDLFPDARIIYLVRDGRANVNSLIEGWRQPRLFPGYQVPRPVRIPGDERGRWAFTLIPGWQDLLSSPLEEVCAWQWIRCNEAVLEQMNLVGNTTPFLTIRHEDLIAQPVEALAQIAGFAQLDLGDILSRYDSGLPQINVVSKPGEEKWKKQNPEAIARILPLIDPLMQELSYESNSS